MGDSNVEILIVDANVLIDFCQADPSVLTLIVRHVAVINVAEPVLDEVDQLDRMAAEALGIRVVAPDFACFTRAAQLAQRSPLQFQDWVCLLLAEEHGWTSDFVPSVSNGTLPSCGDWSWYFDWSSKARFRSATLWTSPKQFIASTGEYRGR